MQHDHDPPEHEITMRLTVTRRVGGQDTPEKRHKVVRALRRYLEVSSRSLYTVSVAEVTGVRRTK